MNKPQNNFDDDWAGLEPEQSQTNSQTIYYAGIGIALLFALLVCGGAAYFVWSQFRERTTANEPPLIVLPTTVVTETAVSPTDSPPAIA
ncbi:hypothetical protein MNBD_CHLOROFLEXI01-2061, partial [hydrothermal vent metagenome]